jgi:hypothetical protein
MSFIHRHNIIHKGMEPETVATILRMTVKPSAIDQINYNDFIKEIKIGHALTLGISSLHPTFRLLQMSACHDIQVSNLNWAGIIDGAGQSAYNVAGIGVVHTPYKYCRSISGTGHIKFLSTIWNVPVYEQDCTIGYYAYSDPGTVQAMGGAYTNGGTNALILRSQTVSTNLQIRVTCSTISLGTQAVGSTGIYAAKRLSSVQSGWYNTTQRVAVTVAPNSMDEILSFGIHGELRNGDVVGCNTTAFNSMHFFGKYAINLGVMKSAIENYIAKYP